MENNPTMTVVAAALVDRDGRVLVQQRSPGRSMAGLWEFPGGKVESGELPETALARELKEELGIDTDFRNFVPATFASAHVAGRHMLLLLYMCRQWHGTPRLLDAKDLRWVTPKEMHSLPMPPADEPFIDVLDGLLGGRSEPDVTVR